MQEAPDYFDFSQLSIEEISDLLKAYQLHLTAEEALTIQHTFLQRPPTYAECVLWSIQASEHCSYKSTRPYLAQFNAKAPQVILGPKEDAGIVAVATDKQNRRYGIVMSHESHNHPSQLVPYEGAATGVGGNVRDVCCMGAEVIAVADSLRFGDINRAKTKWIHQEVVRGIAGYANPLGIPNLGGDTYYDEAYNDNCLVTVVTLGLLREDHIIHSYAPPQANGYEFILVGKPTDNSGFGGAAFASDTLQEDEQSRNKGAIQEPNAFLQRHLLKANYALFDWLREHNLTQKVGFKDLGAGGIACAAVELAHGGGYGAELDLDKVPQSMTSLPPAVVLCSETQERFLWLVPPELSPSILRHYNERFALPEVCAGAQATVIGSIRLDGFFVVKANQQDIVFAKAQDITQGILYERPFCAPKKQAKEPPPFPISDYNALFLKILSHENIASKKPIYECYDKQVQGRTHLEPGWADAGLLTPFNEEKYPEEIRQTGVALSLDHNPRYNKIDAYWGAANAVFESIRNIIAVGAWPLALTDCLCFGNPEEPEQMGEFVEAVKGIRDAAAAITSPENPHHGLPIISGNVSLYNESAQGAIPASPMISCLGTMEDAAQAVTFDLKKIGSVLILVGERQDECGGSVYYQLHHHLGAQLPKPNFNHFAKEISAVHSALQAGLVLAAHDISDGGIAVALAEMSFKRHIGFRVYIPGDLPVDKLLFSESGGFVLEVSPPHMASLEQLFRQKGISFQTIGETTSAPDMVINEVINCPIQTAYHAWSTGLAKRLM